MVSFKRSLTVSTALLAATVATGLGIRSAHATLLLSFNVNGGATTTVVDGTPPDTTPVDGQILLGNGFQPIPNLIVNGSDTIAQGTALRPGTPDELSSSSTSVVNNTGGSVTVDAATGATGFLPSANSEFDSASGTFTNAPGGTITVRFWIDPTNTQGATTANPASQPGTLLDTFTFTVNSTNCPNLNDCSFSFNSLGHNVTAPGAFSMTMTFAYTLPAGGSLISRGQAVEATAAVPEPASLLLLGTGLFGLGAMLRRRSRG